MGRFGFRRPFAGNRDITGRARGGENSAQGYSRGRRQGTIFAELMTDYAPIISKLKRRYKIRIRKWRTSMSGSSWQVTYADGRVVRWVEAPYPRTPISLAIFVHEIGHHVIGFDQHKHRCDEEYHVWRWTLEELTRLGIKPDARIRARYLLSMQYAVGKAMRRGLKSLPEHLQGFRPHAA